MKSKKIKCVVWDLDHTLWNGVLLEDKCVKFNNNVIDIIKALDERGILNSIASKNDYDLAMDKLKEFHLDKYFIYPKINWNAKSESIGSIAEEINIGIDTFAFIDDQDYELAEVSYAFPQVLCLNVNCLDSILNMNEFMPEFITQDTRIRREMYQSEIQRKTIEDKFVGPKVDFLKSLKMVMTIKEAEKEDLKRVEELTVRTHQLNATGYTYSYDELCDFITSSEYKLYVAGLADCYGTYGKIGLLLIKCDFDRWTIKLLLMSCRVMSRGVANVFMNFVVESARAASKPLYAEFIHNENDRNRMMYITYKFAGFSTVEEKKEQNFELLEYDFSKSVSRPDYVEVITNDM